MLATFAPNESESVVSSDMNRATVVEILHNPFAHQRKWEVQGFGMLRTYFSDEVRLQIWDQRLAVFGNNAIHDHPWNFESTIMGGKIFNQRFHYSNSFAIGSPLPRWYKQVRIKPGSEGGPIGEPEQVLLYSDPVEVYGPGESYVQNAVELHITRYDNGTVTLLKRERLANRPDEALSIWRGPVEWTFYRPRPASGREIQIVAGDAFRKHFKEGL